MAVLLLCTSAVENTKWPLSVVTCQDTNIAVKWLNPTSPFDFNYVEKLRLNATCLYGNKTDLKVLTHLTLAFPSRQECVLAINSVCCVYVRSFTHNYIMKWCENILSSHRPCPR